MYSVILNYTLEYMQVVMSQRITQCIVFVDNYTCASL